MVAKILGLIFGGTGAVALLIVLFFTIGNLTFISQASVADGTVIRVQRAGNGYNAEINFTTSDGRAIQFTSLVQSNPPEFEVGQKVRVYYNLNNPAESAKPDSFLSFWFWPGLFGIFVVVFGGIGLVCYSIYYFSQRKIKWLQRNGQRVTGHITSIRLNSAVRNRRKSPHKVQVHWSDPRNGQTHSFESANIWLDPLPFSPGDELSVLIDPKNIRRYYVDTSSSPVRTT